MRQGLYARWTLAHVIGNNWGSAFHKFLLYMMWIFHLIIWWLYLFKSDHYYLALTAWQGIWNFLFSSENSLWCSIFIITLPIIFFWWVWEIIYVVHLDKCQILVGQRFSHEAYGAENVSSIVVVVVLNRLMVDSEKTIHYRE